MSTKNRVLSFMSSFSNRDTQRSPTPNTQVQTRQNPHRDEFPVRQDSARGAPTSTGSKHPYNIDGESPQPRIQRERAPSRPMSMVQTYQPPLMDVSRDTLPELQPIFTFLNSHGNKLYQEGYFLKLDDQNTHGRPNADRTWTECFAQLVGTVLSLWDAAELDAAGQDGEVLPKFINLTDASIKMIESLPTRQDNEAPLQNVLSISTAGKNRYLLHFNSHHSLIQWTAGIRLAMYEHATLQEAYTGALIAGKGKALNNIGIIMERARLPTADWARVRFGAGTPWRRCWCVITPPDEKEVQKLQKQLNKKRSAYDRSKPPLLKGDIKFYDSKKTKKVRPIATISDAYSAFAIYPQSKPLIDASTLVKVEGSITIHSNPPSTTEGFVFVMPEVHPAVSGFEMMLRWLFPVFDTFGLYGRPGRLVADTSDPQSLMFAMPKHRRYGYLEILDVTGLILEPGNASWRESEWRKRMKDLTAKRMTAVENGSRSNSRYSSRRSTRNSFGPSRSRIQFDDNVSIRSSPSITWGSQGPPPDGPLAGIPRTDSAPPGANSFAPPKPQHQSHAHTRSASDTQGLDRLQDQGPSGYDGAYEPAPTPPPHAAGVASTGREGTNLRYMASTPERVSSEDEARITPVRELQELQTVTSPEPVSAPPAFAHAPGAKPASKPYHSPELRRANSRMSNATLSQLAGAGGVAVGYPASEEMPPPSEDQRRRYLEDNGQRGVLSEANAFVLPANRDGLIEGLVANTKPRFSFDQSSPSRPSNSDLEASYSRPPPQFSFSSQNPPTNYQQNSTRSGPTSNPMDEPAFGNRTYEPPNTFTSAQPLDQAPSTYQGHVSQSSEDSTHSTASQPSRLQTGANVNRKPLPARTSSIQTPTSAETTDSAGSLGRHVIDQAAFDMIGRNDQKLGPMQENPIHRQKSGASSIYDDTASTASPDYASTRASNDTRRPERVVDKPRAGVMRTVGDSQAGTVQQGSSAQFNIDFGPTLNLASDRPLRNQSPGRNQSYAAAPQYGRAISPGPAINNYRTDRPPRQRSPAARPGSSGLSNSPQRKPVSTENMHQRNGSGDSRTLPWQPGMSSIGVASSSYQVLTPEQYVQQRAAATPLYAHQRPQTSGNRSNTPTPPPVRNRSSEYLGQLGHSRNGSSVDLLQRPSSRAASTTLGPSGSGDIPTTLSAREQEHVSRMTGQPLVNMAQNKPSAPGGGLIGAIGVREMEKEQLKQGINSRTVQQAIAQRQQQQQMAYQQQYAGQMAADYRAPPAQYGNMGQYPAQFPGHTARQQSWVSPAAQVFAQGGGFTAPPPTFPTPPEQAGSPSQQYPRQNYFQQQQPGGEGRGNSPGYHGHGF